MATEPTRRMVAAGLSARHPGALPWILYLVVSCLVTIYFWTPAALRDIVASLDWRVWEMPLSGLVCMLVGLHAMWAGGAVFGAPAAIRAGDSRDVKAVRT